MQATFSLFSGHKQWCLVDVINRVRTLLKDRQAEAARLVYQSNQKWPRLYTRIHDSCKIEKKKKDEAGCVGMETNQGFLLLTFCAWRQPYFWERKNWKRKRRSQTTRNRVIEAKSPSWRRAEWPPKSSSSIFNIIA